MFASEEMHVEHLQNNAFNFVDAACGVIAQPVEILLRPGYGTRYYPVPVTAAAATLMLFLPIIAGVIMSIAHMIPFVTVPVPRGMFDLASLSELYFLVSAAHGWRLAKRMLYMERETHSKYEGSALPFFKLFPKGDSFWFTRIVLEPAFVFIVSIVLQDLYILQSPVSIYLRFAALALLIKSSIAYFRAWEFLRIAIDNRISAPILTKLVAGDATEEELAPLHLCSFPKGVDPEIRKSAAERIERTYLA